MLVKSLARHRCSKSLKLVFRCVLRIAHTKRSARGTDSGTAWETGFAWEADCAWEAEKHCFTACL
jgi:nucleoside 2-deoxyribosyltransferase